MEEQTYSVKLTNGDKQKFAMLAGDAYDSSEKLHTIALKYLKASKKEYLHKDDFDELQRGYDTWVDMGGFGV